MNMQKALGQPRGIGFGILMMIVTIGIYGYYWSYKTFEELKNYRNQGIGGALGLILMFVGGSIAIPFIAGSEVGSLYAEDGREKPVSGITGLWILLPLIGAIIWFVKVQGALNNFWHSKGAGGAVAAAAPAAQ
jgi:predicted tellurium resistance membrane protein TerC